VGTEDLLRRLENKGVNPRTVAFKKEENIFREGEPGIGLFFLLSGKIALNIRTADGRELGLTVLEPGDVFGEMALTSGERYVTAHALTDGKVAVVRADETMALAKDDFYLAKDILSLIGERLQKAVQAISELMSLSLSARVARHLLDLADADQSLEAQEVDLTQEELATLVGASREAVNRELGRFARRGLLELGRGRIVVRHPEELAKLAK
jgi:CRP/FNR family cyclic AMP-dependent transcriptional regulator